MIKKRLQFYKKIYKQIIRIIKLVNNFYKLIYITHTTIFNFIKINFRNLTYFRFLFFLQKIKINDVIFRIWIRNCLLYTSDAADE